MKKIIVIVLLVSFLLSACTNSNSANTKDPPGITTVAATDDPMVREFYQYYLDKYEDYIYDSRELSGGGLLLVKNANLEAGQKLSVFDTEEFHYFLNRLEACVKNGKPQVNTESIQWADESPDSDLGKEPVWIFYESQVEDSGGDNFFDSKNAVYYDSHFFLLEGNLGRDVVVIVTPPMGRQLSSYSESSLYGITPYDSLGTMPMKVVDERTGLHPGELWHFGYPVWIFVVPEKEITESYELRYGDNCLTGRDIISGTWSIDGCHAPSRPGDRRYSFSSQGISTVSTGDVG